MRKIKFKVWHKKLEQMFDVADLYGLDIDEPTAKSISVWDDEAEDAKFIDSKDFELMQFTGLFDRNGIDIYEDDLVKNQENSDIYRVTWNNWWAQFELDKLKVSKHKTPDINQAPHVLEVVGNIHANTKLVLPEN